MHDATLASRKDLRHFFFLGIEMNAYIIVGHAKDRQFSSTSFEKEIFFYKGLQNCQSTTTKKNLVCQHASFLPQKPSLTKSRVSLIGASTFGKTIHHLISCSIARLGTCQTAYLVARDSSTCYGTFLTHWKEQEVMVCVFILWFITLPKFGDLS